MGALDEKNLILEKFEKSNMSQEFQRDQGSPQKGGEVNEIIVKIEMKKF